MDKKVENENKTKSMNVGFTLRVNKQKQIRINYYLVIPQFPSSLGSPGRLKKSSDASGYSVNL